MLPDNEATGQQCEVCFGRNPIITTVIQRDGRIVGSSGVPCGMCGRVTGGPPRRLVNEDTWEWVEVSING